MALSFKIFQEASESGLLSFLYSRWSTNGVFADIVN